MAKIETLLNPLPDLQQFPYSLPSPRLASAIDSKFHRAPSQKKHRGNKDALPYKKASTRGEVRYPPCEERDEELTKIHRDFQMFPMGEIKKYAAHVPYNSDKKTFQQGTGRDFLEVFHYHFQIPGSDQEWHMMWDYNIGLVRTTHLFKSNGYSKTTSGKVMNANPGLREISHSITGGALGAQGYWIPYEAAKALAAKFCWRIRYALTPLFGLDFPSLCVHPKDRVNFGQLVIDPAIIKKATETANYYRSLELRSPPLSAFQPSPSLRPTSSSGGNYVAAARKKLYPRSHRKHANSLSSTATASSGYGSGVDEYNSDTYCVSPLSVGSYRSVNTFTPVNTPRSADVLYTSAGPCAGPGAGAGIPTPQEVLASISAKVNMVNEDSAGTGTSTDDAETSSTTYSELSSSQSDYSFVDLDDKDEYQIDFRDSPTSESLPTGKLGTNRKRKAEGISLLFAREVKAAHALLSLHMQDASGSDGEDASSPSSLLTGVQQQQHYSQGRKKRRASA